MCRPVLETTIAVKCVYHFSFLEVLRISAVFPTVRFNEIVLRSLSKGVCERRKTFRIHGQWFCTNSIRRKTLSSTNVVLSRQLKEKTPHFRLPSVAQKRGCLIFLNSSLGLCRLRKIQKTFFVEISPSLKLDSILLSGDDFIGFLSFLSMFPLDVAYLCLSSYYLSPILRTHDAFDRASQSRF